MRRLRDKTEMINLAAGSIFMTTKAGVELEYSELEVIVTTCAADPSIGQPEHIDECYVMCGKLDIMSSDGESVFICNLEGWEKVAPEGMEREFDEALEALVWEYLENE